MKRIVALYPRDWRERYGDEVADLADELVRMGETTAARARLGLAAGAAVERWRLLARRDVLVAFVAAGAIAAGLAFAVTHTLHGAIATRPYFDTHSSGLLLTVVMLGWISMEITEFVRGRRSPYWRHGAARSVARSGCWLILAVGVIATNGADYLAPPFFPGAAIRPARARSPSASRWSWPVWRCAGGRFARRAGGTSTTRSGSAPTSHSSPPARTDCCVIPAARG